MIGTALSHYRIVEHLGCGGVAEHVDEKTGWYSPLWTLNAIRLRRRQGQEATGG
jgi:hypothetical protein